MNVYEALPLDEMTTPGRWAECLRPAMRELESRLPGMLDAGAWIHRNVSVSDLERLEGPADPPKANDAWPLMYLVCRFRKVLLGVRLVERCRQDCWKAKTFDLEGTPCFCYAIDGKDPTANLGAILDDICEEAGKIQKRKKLLWRCRSGLVYMNKDGESLAECGLVREEAGGWAATERGEAFGLMTLFTAWQPPQVRWSPSTQKAWKRMRGGESETVPLQTRLDRLEQGLASSDAYAASSVMQLAELPLEAYFRCCPEVEPQDLCYLREALRLPDACRFRTAAAALCRRLREAEGTEEWPRLLALLALFVMPITEMSEGQKTAVLCRFIRRCVSHKEN